MPDVNPPYFDVSNKPWFGPRARARSYLAKRTSVLPPSSAATWLSEFFSRYTGAIQRIRFIDYCHNGEFRYTIALTWTSCDNELRQAIYEKAEDVVAKTGWYPLPQGERIGSRLVFSALERSTPWNANHPTFQANRIIGFEPAVQEGGGTAIRILTDDHTLLLDSALPGQLKLKDTDRALLLTHSHRDHSGNLVQALAAGIPTFLSTGTLGVLDAIGITSKITSRNSISQIQSGDSMQLGGIKVTAFSVPHSPGAIGFCVEDKTSVIVFPGDVSVRTSRHDFLCFLEQLLSIKKRKILFLDATMAGRPLGAGNEDPCIGVLDALAKASNVFIVSSDVEQLVYAYVDVFHCVKDKPDLRNTVSFLCSGKLRGIFELIHAAFIKRNNANLDPFILEQYGNSFSAWAESRWLYWIDRMTLPDVGSPKSIWFITTKELGLVGKAKGIRLLIGRAATEPSETECLGDLSPFDTGAWTQHSNEEQLTSTVMRLCNYADVFLFHNFTSRLSKFIERNRLVARPLRRTLIQDFDLTPKLPGPYCNPTVTSEGNDGLSISSERGFNDH